MRYPTGLLPFVVLILFFCGCSSESVNAQDGNKAEEQKDPSSMTDEELRNFAHRLAHKYIIVDGHVDLPYRLTTKFFKLYREYIGIPIETDKGDFDYVRAKEGGLDAPFMSVYIPSSYQESGGAKEYADSLINMIEQIAEAHPGHFALAGTPSEIEENYKKGLISLPLGMENGAPLLTLEDVAYFQKRGIRYVTLTHSKDNHICDSSYDTSHTHGGLSSYGKKIVEEMNRQGIMIDISHVSDSAFYQVMRLSSAPSIASHSSCRFFTPGWERNMNDDMIRLLAEKGGVIHINFGTSFLDSGIKKSAEKLRDQMREELATRGLTEEDSLGQEYILQFRQQHKDELYADVEMVANHIDHVVKLAGIGHVGFGSDFDGVGDSLPTGLKDVSMYPNLIYVLLKRGYSEEDIAKICYKNTFRVWREVEQVSKRMKNQ